jgi:hypothetical protein
MIIFRTSRHVSVLYFTMLSATQRRLFGRLMDNERQRISKEAVMAYFKILDLTWHLPGGTKEICETTRVTIAGLQAEISTRNPLIQNSNFNHKVVIFVPIILQL